MSKVPVIGHWRCVSLFIAACVAGVGAPAPASAQGFFESLFGGGAYRPAPVYYAPPPVHFAPRERRRAVRHSVPKPARVAPVRTPEPEKPGPYVAPKVLPGPLGRFLLDSTLQRGDVVATPKGLMVFRGREGKRHDAKDFVAVGKAGSLVARKKRAVLAKLDARVKLHQSNRHIMVMTKLEPPIVAQDP